MMLYREVTQKVIDAAHAVHAELGSGHKRGIYQRALRVEFEASSVPFEADREEQIYFRGEVVGHAIIELLVEDKVLVYVTGKSEVPANAYSEARCLMQTRDVPLGLILNFGSSRLDVRRVELAVKESKATGKID